MIINTIINRLKTGAPALTKGGARITLAAMATALLFGAPYAGMAGSDAARASTPEIEPPFDIAVTSAANSIDVEWSYGWVADDDPRLYGIERIPFQDSLYYRELGSDQWDYRHRFSDSVLDHDEERRNVEVSITGLTPNTEYEIHIMSSWTYHDIDNLVNPIIPLRLIQTLTISTVQKGEEPVQQSWTSTAPAYPEMPDLTVGKPNISHMGTLPEFLSHHNYVDIDIDIDSVKWEEHGIDQRYGVLYIDDIAYKHYYTIAYRVLKNAKGKNLKYTDDESGWVYSESPWWLDLKMKHNTKYEIKAILRLVDMNHAAPAYDENGDFVGPRVIEYSSEAIKVMTPPVEVESPEEVSVRNLHAKFVKKHLQITWGAPQNYNARMATTGYVVQYAKQKPGDPRPAADSDAWVDVCSANRDYICGSKARKTIMLVGKNPKKDYFVRAAPMIGQDLGKWEYYQLK